MVAAGFDRRDTPQRVTGDRSSGYRTSGFRDRNSGGYRTPPNREWRPRPAPVLDDHHMAREELSGPCTFHFFFYGEGKRRSSHALKDCRKFIVLQETFANASRAGQPAINAPPPPPGPPPPPPANTANAIQPFERSRGHLGMIHRVVRVDSSAELEPYPKSRGSICMIQKGRITNRKQKLISRQVYLATTSPPATDRKSVV